MGGKKKPGRQSKTGPNPNCALEHCSRCPYDYLNSLGHAVQLQTITPLDDIPIIISAFKAQDPPIKSIYVCSDPYLTVNSKVLNDEAHDTTHGSPYIDTMFEIKEHVDEHGGNAWFGSNFEELFEKAAYYAHEIMTDTATPDKLPIYIASLSGGGAAHTRKKGSKKKGLTEQQIMASEKNQGSRRSACG